ncbi:MAG: TIGR03546 family protein [Candidatus Tenebribacter burtonii]|jgi:uncharacterized protein (TIGR03546 family)|nr:TIGR03546 family protein [Candidatus Tenebribacter burtonii]
MFVFQFLAKFFKILSSAATPGQISGGFILGMIIGLTPFWSLHNLIIILLIIILNVNITMSIFSFGIFSLIAYLIDPLFHNFGYFILVDVKMLHGLWLTLYNIPILALSKYNNTVVMGSFLTSLILLVPFYFMMKKTVVAYREKLEPIVLKWKIIKVIKGSKLYSVYGKLADWRQ